MRSFVSRHKTLAGVTTAFGCLILFSWLWFATASLRGEIDAQSDTAQDHYEVLGYGLPSPWRHEYIRLLNERYGIRFRTMALCIVSGDVRAYADNYNKVSVPAANRKFKHDVFKECAEDAERGWKAKLESRVSTNE